MVASFFCFGQAWDFGEGLRNSADGKVLGGGICIANLLCVANRQATEEQSQDCARDGKGQGSDQGQEEIEARSLAGVLMYFVVIVLLCSAWVTGVGDHSSALGHFSGIEAIEFTLPI